MIYFLVDQAYSMFQTNIINEVSAPPTGLFLNKSHFSFEFALQQHLIWMVLEEDQ